MWNGEPANARVDFSPAAAVWLLRTPSAQSASRPCTVRRLFAYPHRAGACSTYSIVEVLSPSYLLQLSPLTFGHTMPAIAYTSGMFSLPSAARVEAVRPSRELIQFSRCPGGVALAPFLQ